MCNAILGNDRDNFLHFFESIGEPDATTIVWKKIFLDEPTRCECGHWFVLRKGNPIKIELEHDAHH